MNIKLAPDQSMAAHWPAMAEVIERNRPAPITEPMPTPHDENTGDAWTAYDDWMLSKLYLDGWPQSQIAERIGRTTDAVRARLKGLRRATR